jgi:3-methylfumaryl-CoA hydratase
VEINHPVEVGETAAKTSTIREIGMKHGRSGPLCFVTVEHRIEVNGTSCFSKAQNIVYRELPPPGSIAPAVPAVYVPPETRRKIAPDPVMLFRYSAHIFIAIASTVMPIARATSKAIRDWLFTAL